MRHCKPISYIVNLRFLVTVSRRNSLTHTLNLTASDVSDMRLDEILFCYGFVKQVLDGSIHVAAVVGFHDFFRKLREK